jgi:3-oxoacyl-[acyl-carrier protein] reductase
MDLGLTGKNAIVTGGSHGLGKAVCLSLAAEGVSVAVNYNRNAEKAAELQAELQRVHGVGACVIQADVAAECDIVRLFDEVEAALGPIDILVNNAGVCPVCLIKDMSEEVWSRTIQTNLTGTFLTSREMVRRLLAQDRPGRIVNIVSPAAFYGSSSGKTHYAASKAGVVALTVSLAREVAAQGIAVNAVAPGMMLTEMTAETLRVNADRYRASIPLGRIAETAEVADVITFLASEKSAYITGATVDVSGGLLMR